MGRTAAVYARISLDRHDGLGVGRQEADCRALAERLGWEVAGVYVDNDLSATSAKRRPAYLQLLADIEAGVVDAVVAYHPDRLHRRPLELETFIDVIDTAKAEVQTVAAGNYDLTTATGKMSARIVGAVARAEAERIGEKVSRAKQQMADQGRPSGGGRRPYGYAHDRVTVIPEEAAVLRSAALRVLAGESYGRVAATLGDGWDGGRLCRLLTGPRWTGLRTYKGRIVGEAAWPAIIPRSQWEQFVHLAELRIQGPRGARSLLSGVLHCGRCGGRMYRTTTVYRCYVARKGCGTVSITTAAADGYVTQVIEKALEDPRLLNRTKKKTTSDVTDKIAAAEAKLADVARMFAAGEIEMVEWRAMRSELAERVQVLRDQRKASTTVPIDLRRAWVDGDRNAVVRAVLPRLVVAPVGKGARVPVGERISRA